MTDWLFKIFKNIFLQNVYKYMFELWIDQITWRELNAFYLLRTFRDSVQKKIKFQIRDENTFLTARHYKYTVKGLH